MTRSEVVNEAAEKCLKELYQYAKPSVTWNKFLEENKIYSNLYQEWKEFKSAEIDKDKNEKRWKEKQIQYPEWVGKSREECIGLKPFEFYYLPKDIFDDIATSYIHAYKLDEKQDLLDTINTLKDYCKSPTIDKYIEKNGDEPGYRGYEHPDNLEEEMTKLFNPFDCDGIEMAIKAQNKFFEFLDMAGKFYKWNGDLNAFNMTIYLGASPMQNKEIVINNWKKYRGKDIELDDKQIEKEYYGEEA